MLLYGTNIDLDGAAEDILEVLRDNPGWAVPLKDSKAFWFVFLGYSVPALEELASEDPSGYGCYIRMAQNMAGGKLQQDMVDSLFAAHSEACRLHAEEIAE